MCAANTRPAEKTRLELKRVMSLIDRGDDERRSTGGGGLGDVWFCVAFLNTRTREGGREGGRK